MRYGDKNEVATVDIPCDGGDDGDDDDDDREGEVEVRFHWNNGLWEDTRGDVAVVGVLFRTNDPQASASFGTCAEEGVDSCGDRMADATDVAVAAVSHSHWMA